MRYFISIISIFLISKIHNRCSTEDDGNTPINAEECFSKAITSEDIRNNNSNDYSCCYIKYFENSNPNCVTVENSRKSTYLDDIKRMTKMDVYAFGCSLDELPDESNSNTCGLAFPIKEDYCFTRTISETEKNQDNFKPNKCCYLRSDEINFNFCTAIEESKKNDYIELIKQKAREGGVTGDINIEINCSQSFLKINILMIFIMLKIILL